MSDSFDKAQDSDFLNKAQDLAGDHADNVKGDRATELIDQPPVPPTAHQIAQDDR